MFRLVAVLLLAAIFAAPIHAIETISNNGTQVMLLGTDGVWTNIERVQNDQTPTNAANSATLMADGRSAVLQVLDHETFIDAMTDNSTISGVEVMLYVAPVDPTPINISVSVYLYPTGTALFSGFIELTDDQGYEVTIGSSSDNLGVQASEIRMDTFGYGVNAGGNIYVNRGVVRVWHNDATLSPTPHDEVPSPTSCCPAPSTSVPTPFEPTSPTPVPPPVPPEGCEGPPPVPDAVCVRENWEVQDLSVSQDETVMSNGTPLQLDLSNIDLTNGDVDVVVVTSQSNCLNGSFSDVNLTGGDLSCVRAEQQVTTATLTVELIDTCNDGLSRKALVGILVGSFVGVAIISVIVVLVCRKYGKIGIGAPSSGSISTAGKSRLDELDEL